MSQIHDRASTHLAGSSTANIKTRSHGSTMAGNSIAVFTSDAAA
ncbi:hypothetical protein [Shimia sp.]